VSVEVVVVVAVAVHLKAHRSSVSEVRYSTIKTVSSDNVVHFNGNEKGIVTISLVPANLNDAVHLDDISNDREHDNEARKK
jgi:hypothetical protein